MEDIFNTPANSVIYEDNNLYIALAYKPLTKGHTVVVWKDSVKDLNMLSSNDYEYLMDAVDVARKTLMEYYDVRKVYLMYLDEANQVHWHLIPRYDEMGFNILNHEPKTLVTFDDRDTLREAFTKKGNEMLIEN